MTNRRTNRALSSTRRWTAGLLLTSTLVTGGIGLHLADAYASTQTGTVAASTASTGSTTSSSTTAGSTSSGSTSSSSSFGNTSSVSSSSNTATTTTKGS